MKTIIKNCLNCDNQIEIALKEHKRGNGKFCNRACSSKFNGAARIITDTNASCAYCQKEFWITDKRKLHSKSGLNFCSRPCKDLAQRVDGIPEYHAVCYNTLETKAYRALAFRNYPHSCADCGYDKHSDVLQVHHVDEDRSNNQLNNLVILCPLCHKERHLGHRENNPMEMVDRVGFEPT